MSEYDVIVVGGGGAGLAGAVSAAEAGAKVLLVESEKEIGGTTKLSSGNFTAAGTSVQRALGVEDDANKFFQHYMDLNQWKLQPGLIRTLCEHAAPTFEWLLGLGVEVPAQLSTNAHMPGLTQAGVEDVWRGHVPKDEGYGLVETLDGHRKRLKVDVVLQSRVQRIRTGPDGVTGIVVDDTDVDARAVIVTTGGLAQDPGMVEKYFPLALEAGERRFIVSAPGSRGDHIRFAEQVGAEITGEGRGLLLLSSTFQRHHHWQSGFPPKARLYVDATGHRFMDEDAPYAVSGGILHDHGGFAWAIFDDQARLGLDPGFADWTPDRILEEVELGTVFRADTVAELATRIGVDAVVLTSTVEEWNRTLPQGNDPGYLRHLTLQRKGTTDPLPRMETGPFHAVKMVAGELAITHTGLLINHGAAVLGRARQPIRGLYAAGEAGGGVLGERYIGGGNSIANAMTFGRIAGQGAAKA